MGFMRSIAIGLILMSLMLAVDAGPAAAARRSADPQRNAVNVYDPAAKIDFAQIDPRIDPGVDPVFQTEPFFKQADEYKYVFTKPGDHRLPGDVVALQFDVKAAGSLGPILLANRNRLAACKGLAIYLKNGTALDARDQKAVQTFTKPTAEGGLGLASVETLYLYNLKSLDGGTESTTPAMPGTPIRVFMWDNGWQGSSFKNLVLDDLEEVKDGTFCDNRFESVSLRAARTIGVMAFGGHRKGGPPLTKLYLPSVLQIKDHAFRRNKRLLAVSLPKVTQIDPYAFDDDDKLQYVHAPELRKMGRNVFNDNGGLISVNLPKLEYCHVACWGPNDSMRILRLPAMSQGYDLSTMRAVRFLYVPSLKALSAEMIPEKLQALYAPNVQQVRADTFAHCPDLHRVDLPAGVKIGADALGGRTDIVVTIGGQRAVLR